MRTARLTTILSLVLLSVGAINSRAQSPTPSPTPAAKADQKSSDARIVPAPKPIAALRIPTGAIKGRVVAEDGRPVTNATISAGSSAARLSQKVTRVDSEGRFSFEDLPADNFTITALAPGYIDQSLLTSDPDLVPRYLIGSQVKIVMVKGGVITGTVTDSRGQPVVGAPISAVPVSGLSVTTSYMFGLFTSDETDDRGVYRIFGLPPGQYTVAAGGGGPFGYFNASGFEFDVPTFYPSGTRDTAVAVTVHAGEETNGIDIRYRGLEGHAISGTVTGTIENNPGSAISMMLTHASTSSVLSLSIVGTQEQQRSFAFNAVGDGEYDLLALFLADPAAEPLVGTKRVVVRGADVTGVEVRMSKLASIGGTLTLDPIKAENKCDKRGSFITETNVSAPRDEPRKAGGQVLTQLFSFFGGKLTPAGEFAARNLEAGRYRLKIAFPTEAWYVRSIVPPPSATGPKPPGARVVESWQGLVTVKSGEQAGPYSISIGQDAAGLRGGVELTTEKTIPPGLRVHLVPVEREEANNVLRYSESTVDSNGSFVFANLAPGRYFITAVREPVDDKAPSRPVALDPVMRSKLRRQAETANVIVELKPCQQLIDYKLPLKPIQ